MKGLENTSENKSRFFALYWRQKVMRTEQTAKILCDPLAIGHGDWYLELTPLSQITDEDAINITLMYSRFESQPREWSQYRFKNTVKPLLNKPWLLQSRIIDYLRSKGYYVGDGTEVEFGWCKLVKGESNADKL